MFQDIKMSAITSVPFISAAHLPCYIFTFYNARVIPADNSEIMAENTHHFVAITLFLVFHFHGQFSQSVPQLMQQGSM